MNAIASSLNPAAAGPGMAAARQIAQGAQLQLAAGILAQFATPLGASPFASAMLPQALAIRCFTCLAQAQQAAGLPAFAPTAPAALPEPAAQWNTQLTGRNTANVDLGDGYTLRIDERNSEVFIKNANTGETTRIWGDPHVDVDGRHAFDFWGTTTFTLENGTKITINTEQWQGNPNAYVASQVLITKGDNAIVVDGISQNQLGDLSISTSQNGEVIDALARDGFVLHENAAGAGWLSEHTGEIATQRDLDATRVGAEYGPGSQMPSLGETAELMGSFLLLGMMTMMLGQLDGEQFHRR